MTRPVLFPTRRLFRNGNDQCAHRGLVRSIAEMQREGPASVRLVFGRLRNRDGHCLAVANLRQRVPLAGDRQFVSQTPVDTNHIRMADRQQAPPWS